LLSPFGDVRGKYDKVHLVPYGEYVPLRDLLPFIEGFTAGIGDFSKGAGFHPLFMDDKKIGVLICYEGILPSAARAYKTNPPDCWSTSPTMRGLGQRQRRFNIFP